MCGIGGYVKLDKRKTLSESDKLNVISLLDKLQDRGTHAWGVYIEKTGKNHHLNCGIKDDSIPGELYKEPKSVDDFFQCNAGRLYLDGTHTILMHTRQQTGGDPANNINNHPSRVIS